MPRRSEARAAAAQPEQKVALGRRFVRPKAIKEYLKCSICMEVFNSPSSLPCGHTFCEECIVSWKASKIGGCPHCRAAISSIHKNVVVESVIDDLPVRCPFRRKCQWKGCLKEMEPHARNCPDNPAKLPAWIPEHSAANFPGEDAEDDEDEDEHTAVGGLSGCSCKCTCGAAGGDGRLRRSSSGSLRRSSRRRSHSQSKSGGGDAAAGEHRDSERDSKRSKKTSGESSASASSSSSSSSALASFRLRIFEKNPELAARFFERAKVEGTQ
uniref:RING-type domain-containing protein n=1 Tax=Chromera velia CCMP2878 TaxID=1169474 RepID=A0A0G4H758_9ALVE|eukprot:Cvel_24931.t1-p1 / transcript=Cvel_24931.t1 / gene=Cvel_24931 / organism=Chromera_velia_CCMP2878 / gene_product=PDZ domain-containing RING finger protein 4, putative / transcript_product=PDZ domain-containing RING finger protein 4, putative / location=Cvel_scaffold2758:8662-10354(-) / protein_length=268 / sequence_SO=supercontig / SO=protein_coding / is_pseudo=false